MHTTPTTSLSHLFLVSFFIFCFTFSFPTVYGEEASSTDETLHYIKQILGDKFISWKNNTVVAATTATSTLTSSTSPMIGEATTTASTTVLFWSGEKNTLKEYVKSYNDPYTTYFNAEESKAFKESVKGSFGGVGMSLGFKDNHVIVVNTIKDTPSYKAGITSDDRVLKIEGTSTEFLPLPIIVEMIRGEIGTKVHITIGKASSTDEKVYTLERAKISLPILTATTTEGVFVITLHSFSEDSAEQFRQALITFSKTKKEKLIIDIRGNGGGYLESAIDIASFFLPKGTVILSEKRGKGNDDIVHLSKGFNFFGKKLKVVVLIDEQSASASEIVAGALHDNTVATIVGKKSFGKGSVQELIDICSLEKKASSTLTTTSASQISASSTETCNKGSIKVTVATWYTPKGISISEKGIEPDVFVNFDPIQKNIYGKDTQLLKAIETVKGNIKGVKSMATTTVFTTSKERKK